MPTRSKQDEKVKAERCRLRARLLEKQMTLNSFARKHGFKPRTVHSVVGQYWGKWDKNPIGIMTHTILYKLKEEIGDNQTDSEMLILNTKA